MSRFTLDDDGDIMFEINAGFQHNCDSDVYLDRKEVIEMAKLLKLTPEEIKDIEAAKEIEAISNKFRKAAEIAANKLLKASEIRVKKLIDEKDT